MLRLLEQALAVEMYRNLHTAARSLSINASTLSRGIQTLESELGVQLFNRSHNMEPTEFGQIVLARARSLISDVDTMRNEILNAKGLAVGTLAVASGPLVSHSWLHNAVASFAGRYPGISLRLEEVSWWRLPEVLDSGRFDLAIGEMLDPNLFPNVVLEPLPRRPGAFFSRLNHPLTQSENLTLEELAAYPLVSPRLPARTAKVLPSRQKFGTLHPGGQFFDPHIICESLSAAFRIISNSDAISISLRELIHFDIEAGRIIALPFKADWLSSSYSIMRLRGRTLSGAANAFRAAIVAAESAYFIGRKSNGASS